jgi:hypothetical protein
MKKFHLKTPKVNTLPWGFMEKLEEFSIMDVIECFDSIKMSKKLDIDTEELQEMVTWLKVYQNEFDCQKVNQDLLQYSEGR